MELFLLQSMWHTHRYVDYSSYLTMCVSVCFCVFDPVTLTTRLPAWDHPRGIAALALLTEYPLRTGKPHLEAHQNRRGKARETMGTLLFDSEAIRGSSGHGQKFNKTKTYYFYTVLLKGDCDMISLNFVCVMLKMQQKSVSCCRDYMYRNRNICSACKNLPELPVSALSNDIWMDQSCLWYILVWVLLWKVLTLFFFFSVNHLNPGKWTLVR